MTSLNLVRRGTALAAGFAAVLAVAAPAVADEMWTSEAGNIEYFEDLGSIAVFSVDGGMMFIDGLAGNYNNRGDYVGYWMDYDVSEIQCDWTEFDEYGNESWSWGGVYVTFLDPAFPSRWQATLYGCDTDQPVAYINANPF